MLTQPSLAGQACPGGQHRLVTDEGDEPPWCEHCLWNLDAIEPGRFDGRLRRRLLALDRRWGFRLAMALHRSLAGREAQRPRAGASTLWLTAISGVLLAAMLLLMAFGLWLIIWYPWPAKLLGTLIVLLAFALRPRLGRLRPVLADYDEVTRDEAPALFGLIDRVAAEAGTPRPHRVVFGAEWNAFATSVGLRRTRVLMLGLPLFHCLRPQERVALLGHEMGHFANGDLRTGLLTRPATQTFGTLAGLFYPDNFAHGRGNDGLGLGLMIYLAEMVIKPLLYLVSYSCFLLHLGINMIAAREGQRAEYYADLLAARVAGSRAATTEMDVYLSAAGMMTIVGARSRAGLDWREAVEGVRTTAEPRLIRRRQLSVRHEASVLASHPPTGMRREMLARTAFDPRVRLTDAEAGRIDAELASLVERYRRAIAHSW